MHGQAHGPRLVTTRTGNDASDADDGLDTGQAQGLGNGAHAAATAGGIRGQQWDEHEQHDDRQNLQGGGGSTGGCKQPCQSCVSVLMHQRVTGAGVCTKQAGSGCEPAGDVQAAGSAAHKAPCCSAHLEQQDAEGLAAVPAAHLTTLLQNLHMPEEWGWRVCVWGGVLSWHATATAAGALLGRTARCGAVGCCMTGAGCTRWPRLCCVLTLIATAVVDMASAPPRTMPAGADIPPNMTAQVATRDVVRATCRAFRSRSGQPGARRLPGWRTQRVSGDANTQAVGPARRAMTATAAGRPRHHVDVAAVHSGQSNPPSNVDRAMAKAAAATCLQAAQAEHQLGHAGQARQGQLQADVEQQEHHTQLGQVGHGVHVADDVEGKGPDRHAAQLRAQQDAGVGGELPSKCVPQAPA